MNYQCETDQEVIMVSRRQWRESLMEWLDAEFPKGSVDRDHAIVHACLFMLWLEKNWKK